MTNIPWNDLIKGTLMAFFGLSMVCLPVAVAAVRDVEITRAHVGRYFGYILAISLTLSLLAVAQH